MMKFKKHSPVVHICLRTSQHILYNAIHSSTSKFPKYMQLPDPVIQYHIIEHYGSSITSIFEHNNLLNGEFDLKIVQAITCSIYNFQVDKCDNKCDYKGWPKKLITNQISEDRSKVVIRTWSNNYEKNNPAIPDRAQRTPLDSQK